MYSFIAEQKYSQIEKEGLAIVFSVKRFHQYLHSREFTIYSDHKPLEFLFSENRQTLVMALSRIQRWALTLGSYQYQIHHCPGSKMGNADALSCLYLSATPESVPSPGDLILLTSHLSEQLITSERISQLTDKDPVLSRVRRFVLHGWADGSPGAEVKPYYDRRYELSVLAGCVVWGARIVIPLTLWQSLLGQLHETHLGVCKMKGLVRSYIWWLGLDSDIETKVCECSTCQLQRPMPSKAPLHPWEWSHRPWARVHVDHAGPYLGHLFLVAMDAHSKWTKAYTVPSTSTEATIKILRRIFSTHGLPEQIVLDNGTSFTSQEFALFLSTNGVKHTLVPPYHPSSNGLAERAVQTVLDYEVVKAVDPQRI